MEKFLGLQPYQTGSKDPCNSWETRTAIVGEPFAMGISLAGLFRSKINQSFRTNIYLADHPSPNPTFLPHHYQHIKLFSWDELPCDYVGPLIPQNTSTFMCRVKCLLTFKAQPISIISTACILPYQVQKWYVSAFPGFCIYENFCAVV